MTALSAADRRQRRILLVVLGLNAALFLGLGVAGVMADSSALIANALDNGSDAVVYLLSFLAVGRALAWKRRAARVSGIMLLVFAAGVLADVVRRSLAGAEPVGMTMMGMAAVAAVVNLVCLELIRRGRSDDVNMRAAETFSFNDFASNGGILIAGGLVLWLKQPWPDLVVGALVALIALKGGLDILKDANNQKDRAP
ncbi:MAG: cation transporter [Pseudomonadota bacterium]